MSCNIFKLWVIAANLLLASPSFAELFPNSVKIIGRGIQNETTQELLLLACVGEETEEVNGINCHNVRFVRYPKNQTPSWMGESFSSKNIYLIARDLKDLYRSSFKTDILQFYRAQKTVLFTDQQGWNWAVTPSPVTDSEFKRLLMTSLYYAALRNSEDTSQSATLRRDFEVGDTVLVGTDLEREFRVEKVLENGSYQLSDGASYFRNNLIRSLPTLKGWHVGQTVKDTNYQISPEGQVFNSEILRISEDGKVYFGKWVSTTVRTLDDLIAFQAHQGENEYLYAKAGGNFGYERLKIAGTDTRNGQVLIDSLGTLFVVSDKYKTFSQSEVFFQAGSFKVGDEVLSPGTTDAHKILGFVNDQGKVRAIIGDVHGWEHTIDLLPEVSTLRRGKILTEY